MSINLRHHIVYHLYTDWVNSPSPVFTQRNRELLREFLAICRDSRHGHRSEIAFLRGIVIQRRIERQRHAGFPSLWPRSKLNPGTGRA